MKRSSRPTKTPANLSESINHHLNMYALAASAAGVGALVLARPAEAKIVYTPAHHVISHHGRYLLDLNHDGIADFILREQSYCNTDSCQSQLLAGPARKGNGVERSHVRSTGSWGWAYEVTRGSQIGPARHFSAKLMAVALSGNTWDYLGPWGGVKNGYLGLTFRIHGQVHYGWARLSTFVKGGLPIVATLHGYAYETVPNKPIIAGKTKEPDDISVEDPDAALTMPTPEPARLGALAMGAPGLSIWRREERRSHLDT
jgi:hypothetical protein